MTLRSRLSLIVSLLFVAGMALGLVYQVLEARQRVSREVESSARLVFRLLDELLPPEAGPGLAQADVERLRRSFAIEDARHLDIRLLEGGAAAPPPQDRPAAAAPDWFLRLVRPEELRLLRPLGPPGGQVIELSTDPVAEIEEAWQECTRFLALLLLVFLLLHGVLFVTVGRWLRPVEGIVAGLKNAEAGDYSGEVPERILPELRLIAEKLNQLTRVLQASRRENDRLTRLSLRIQEEERRLLAQELHDEMGQSISAIKAIAFSILRRSAERDPTSAGGARQIAESASRLRDQVRNLMNRLRPYTLDELGLLPALQQMVDDWNNAHDDLHCQLRCEGDFPALDDERRIHLYRIAQEALTNIARHAGARQVELLLRGGALCELRVQDDGRGLPAAPSRQGRGLAGIAERVRALGGHWELQSRAGGGTLLRLSFPAEPESGTANPSD